VAGGGEDEGDCIALGAGEDVAAKMAVRLHLADRRLDAGTPPDLAADGGRHTAPLTREEDAALVGFARPAVFGVVAAVAGIDRGALDGATCDALGLGDLGGQRVACAGVARQGAHAEHDLSDRHWTVGGGAGLGGQQFKPVGAIALAPAGHRAAVARQSVLDVALAAAERDRGAVEEAGAEAASEKPSLCLIRCSPTMRRVGQSGPADTVAGERAEGGSEALPVDQASQAHQGMATVDQVHERRAEEFGLVGRRRYGRHRRAPARRRGEGLTPVGRHKRESGFASVSPVADRNLANADTCAGRKPK
jgi:hypothetical protein